MTRGRLAKPTPRGRDRHVIAADGTRRPIFVRSPSGLGATASVKARAERIMMVLGPPLR